MGQREGRDSWAQPTGGWSDLTQFALQLLSLGRTNTSRHPRSVMHNLKVTHMLVILFTGGKASQSRSKLRSRQRTFTSHESQGQDEAG